MKFAGKGIHSFQEVIGCHTANSNIMFSRQRRTKEVNLFSFNNSRYKFLLKKKVKILIGKKIQKKNLLDVVRQKVN